MVKFEEIYTGWLTSTSLIKRSLAICGHYWLGCILVFGSALIVAFIIGLFIGIFS